MESVILVANLRETINKAARNKIRKEETRKMNS